MTLCGEVDRNRGPGAPELTFISHIYMRKIGIIASNKAEVMPPINPDLISLSSILQGDKF